MKMHERVIYGKMVSILLVNILSSNFLNFFNHFALNRNYNINNNTILLRLTDYQLYGNQISNTLSEGSAGVSNKEFIEGEGIKYKKTY